MNAKRPAAESGHPTAPEKAKAPPSGDRDNSGKFVAGNTIGKLGGRPPREIEEQYREAFLRGCPIDQLERIVRSLAAKAESGSLEAAKLLLRHALPSPSLRVDIETDRREYRVAGESPGEHMTNMMKYITAQAKQRRDYETRLRASGYEIGRNKPTGSRSKGRS